MKVPKRFVRDSRGSVLAFVTLSMVIILSFGAGVMDIGQLYETRHQLQTGVDGSALAGAQLLAMTGSTSQAINAAFDYAQRNGISTSEVDPNYPLVTSEGPYTNNAVQVSASRNLNLLVAGLFNNGVGNVNARAEAVIAPVLPTEGLWPWGVPQSAITPGQELALKVGSPPPSNGNFRPLDYPPFGGGASSYIYQVENGYGQGSSDYVSPTLPWSVPTQTGNIAGDTLAAVNYLTGLASSSGQDDINSSWNQPVNTCTWPNAPKTASDPNVPPPAGFVGDASECYRIGVIPILRNYAVNGKGQVDIIGWGAFYLVGYSPAPGGLTNVWGYFLDKAVVNGGRTNWGAPLSGLIGVRLWR